MKKVYIPKGETVTYDRLNTVNIVVRGTLIVKGKLTANTIQGGGRVEVEEQAAPVGISRCNTAKTQICSREIKIFILSKLNRENGSGHCPPTDFIESLHVLTKSLFITLSSISQCDAEEIIMLLQKKRGLLGMLFASKLQTIFTSTFHSKEKGGKNQVKSPVEEVIEPKIEDAPQNINGFDKQLVAEIMQYLDENGYIKFSTTSNKKTDINIEYEEEVA